MPFSPASSSSLSVKTKQTKQKNLSIGIFKETKPIEKTKQNTTMQIGLLTIHLPSLGQTLAT